ncbi:MAG TPA: TlpA disulfide reductase family protein, partial [Thermoanaerobaculia bacterium]|nr:TlpA disulfide reductase family protein [Thermoanaerobaculia bacterium]
MRSKLFPLALVASLLSAFLLPDGAAAAKAQVGSPAPQVSLATLDGTTLTNADLKGKVVLLDFWATWCKPCVMALPELKALSEEMAGEPFVLVSLSADKNKSMLEKFVKKHGMTWPQFWDPKMEVTYRTFGVDSFPTYIVLDAEGDVVLRHRGWAPKRTDQ